MKYIITRFAALNPDTLRRLGITHLLNAAEPGPGRNTITLSSITSKTGSSTSVDLSGVDMTKLDYLGLQLADNRHQDISCYFR